MYVPVMSDQALPNIKPLADRIIIQRVEPDEKTPGGIIIPKTANDQEISWKAKVIAVGEGRLLDNGQRVAPDLKKGDTVFVGKYVGTRVTVDGQEFYAIREDDVLGVVEP